MRLENTFVEELTTAEAALIGFAARVGVHVLPQLLAHLELGIA